MSQAGPPFPRREQTARRQRTLRGPKDFQRVRAAGGLRQRHPLFSLYATRNTLGPSRVGVTVSRHTGKAVIRNRFRRRVHEALRAVYPRLAPGWDIVIVARLAGGGASWIDLRDALHSVLMRSRLLQSGNADDRLADPITGTAVKATEAPIPQPL